MVTDVRRRPVIRHFQFGRRIRILLFGRLLGNRFLTAAARGWLALFRRHVKAFAQIEPLFQIRFP